MSNTLEVLICAQLSKMLDFAAARVPPAARKSLLRKIFEIRSAVQTGHFSLSGVFPYSSVISKHQRYNLASLVVKALNVLCSILFSKNSKKPVVLSSILNSFSLSLENYTKSVQAYLVQAVVVK